jgi:hypothetical protein
VSAQFEEKERGRKKKKGDEKEKGTQLKQLAASPFLPRPFLPRPLFSALFPVLPFFLLFFPQILIELAIDKKKDRR